MKSNNILLTFEVENLDSVLDEMKKVKQKEDYVLVYKFSDEMVNTKIELFEDGEEIFLQNEDVIFVEFLYVKKDKEFYTNYEQKIYEYNKNLEKLFTSRKHTRPFHLLMEEQIFNFIQSLVDEFNVIFEEERYNYE